MAFPGDPTSITIDGKKFKLGELKGEIESIRSMFMFDRKELDTKTIYAFRDEKSIKNWAKDNSLDQWYKHLRSGKRPGKGTYTPEQEAELKKTQKAEVDWQTKRFATTLAQNGIDSSDSDAIIKLIENPDPRRGPILGSVTIFEHDNHRGSFRYLPNCSRTRRTRTSNERGSAWRCQRHATSCTDTCRAASGCGAWRSNTAVVPSTTGSTVPARTDASRGTWRVFSDRQGVSSRISVHLRSRSRTYRQPAVSA